MLHTNSHSIHLVSSVKKAVKWYFNEWAKIIAEDPRLRM